MRVLPDLRVVPFDRIRPHERVDPLRVDRLLSRLEGEGVLVNPPICVPGEEESLVLLDGATRHAALRRLELSHLVVQVVSAEHLSLETWHHVLHRMEAADLIDAIRHTPGVELTEDDGLARIHSSDRPPLGVRPKETTVNSTLVRLVETYAGRWKVSRVTEPDPAEATDRYDDWSALIEFPRLTIGQVQEAASSGDLLPAGITRFIVPERALRLNLDLSMLRGHGDIAERQEALERLLEERIRAGRVRRYEEPVVILDE